MATNTAMNIGVRRNFSTLGDRNYEPLGGAQYTSNRDGLELGGVTYDTGETIEFDDSASGSSPYDRYSDDALMERYFNEGLITPTT